MTQTVSLPERTRVEQAPPKQEPGKPVHGARRFPRQGEWTYEDWLDLPDDGWKYEIIDGVLQSSPPPLILHQRLSIRVSSRMNDHTEQDKLGIVLTAPCGVRLPGQSVPFEPDILFIKAERRSIIGERYVEGAPDLIVEILSPSNADYDLETKFQIYQAAGVPEYWLINPWERSITIYNLSAGIYQLSGEYREGDTEISQELSGFTLEVATLSEL